MTRPDIYTHDETSAGEHAQLSAHDDRPTKFEIDMNERGNEAGDGVAFVHECTSPDVHCCLHCALAKRIDEQRERKEAARVKAEVLAQRAEEWWSE